MTTKDFVKAVATEAEIPQTQVKKVLDAIPGVLVDVAKAHDSVRFAGMKAEGVEVEAREGVAALNGKEWSSPAHTIIKIKPLSALKASVRE